MLQRLTTPWDGIDVSEWQGEIDFQKVKASGKKFVIIRAGYGRLASQKDPFFDINYKNAKAAGLYVGVYWYSYAENPEDAKLEAKACLEVIRGKQLDLPVYFDFEEQRFFATGKQFCSDCIKAFCSEMEAAGYWVGLYIYRSALENYVTTEVANRYAMAIAEYGPKLNYSGQYGIWQNSSTWKVDGISGDVDHDYCYVDYPALIKERGKNGYSPATTTVETTQDTDILTGTAEKPPVAQRVSRGARYVIDKTYKVGTATFGKIKGTTNWIDMGHIKHL